MVPQAATDQYRIQQAIAATTASSLAKLWRQLGADFSLDWLRVRPQMLRVMQAGRLATVEAALPYMQAVLDETGQVGPPTGVLVASRFTAAAPDGRLMLSLFDEYLIATKVAVAGGASSVEALAGVGRLFTSMNLTVLADTRRQVFHADLIQRPRVSGYTRMLNPPSCSRCIVLAGKWFGWNKGFQRHPRCDCIHIPSSEALAGESMLDPKEYFDSLSSAQQDATFTKSGARAIREGADIGRVVSRQRMPSALSRPKGSKPVRLTVDDIYRVAGSRSNAIRLLTQEGFILPRVGA